jgi:hypothetical protein
MLPELKVKIGLDDSALQAGLARVSRNLAGVAGAALGGLVVAAGAASAGLIALTRNSLANIDAQAKLARQLGGTTAAVQGLTRAAGLAGVSSGELTSAAERMNARLGQIIVTGEGAEATFRALGLTAQQLANMDVDERFAVLADRMRAAGMSSQQMAHHLRELGVRQASITRFLQAGGEEIRNSRRWVEEFGVAVSDIDASAIERANDAMSDIGTVLEGIGNRLAVAVAPHLERFALTFTELARQGGPIAAAVDQVVVAASSLMNVLSQPETVQGFADALAGLIGLAANVAQGIVWLTQNVEMFTAAASAAAIALAVLGGPVSALWIAAGAAAAGIMVLRSRTEEQAGSAESTARAHDELNRALGVFSSTAAPAAQQAALVSARRLEAEALAALSAAQAHRELALARVQALEGMGDGGATNPAIGGVRQDLADAETRILDILRQLENARMTARALIVDVGGGGAGGAPAGGGGIPNTPAVPSIGGGGAVADQFAQRLEALMAGLQTEREVVEAWYQEGMETLQDGLDRRLLTEEEFLQARTRLQEEYARRSNAIEDDRMQNSLRTVTDGLNEIVSAMGQGNSRALRVVRGFAAGMAWIDTLMGAARELRKGTLGFATAAAVIAKGLAFVNAIRSTSNTGSGSVGSSAASAGGNRFLGGGQQTQQQGNPLVINMDIAGDYIRPGDLARAMTDQVMNELRRRGVTMNVAVRGLG